MGRQRSTRTCLQVRRGKPCKGKHHALDCCKDCYNRLHAKRCKHAGCGRRAFRGDECYGHFMRGIGAISADLPLGERAAG